jgi:hypothetical protein
MRNLILSNLFYLLFVLSASAQTVKVEGVAGSVGNYITHFYGDYFTVQKNDGYAVVDLSGKVLVSGINAPVVDFGRKLSIHHNIFFADVAGDMVLKNVNGKTLASGKYSVCFVAGFFAI